MKRFFPWLGLVLFLGCFLVLVFRGIHIPSHLRFWEPQVFDTVVIDAGHGGKDPGAVGNGLMEKNLTLDVALRLKEHLELAGLRTVMTREEDRYLALNQRARISNQQHGAIFVSIHFNTSSSRTARGLETYYYLPSGGDESVLQVVGEQEQEEEPPTASEVLAAEVQLSVIAQSTAFDRGIKQGDFYVIRNSRNPAILIEGGFLSNPSEAKLLESTAYRETLAAGIADGIIQYHRKVADEAKSDWWAQADE